MTYGWLHNLDVTGNIDMLQLHSSDSFRDSMVLERALQDQSHRGLELASHSGALPALLVPYDAASISPASGKWVASSWARAD